MGKLDQRLQKLEATRSGKFGVVFLRHPVAGACAQEVADFDHNITEAKARGVRVFVACNCATPYPASQGVEVMPIAEQYLRMLDHTEPPPRWQRPEAGSVGDVSNLPPEHLHRLMTGGNTQ